MLCAGSYPTGSGSQILTPGYNGCDNGYIQWFNPGVLLTVARTGSGAVMRREIHVLISALYKLFVGVFTELPSSHSSFLTFSFLVLFTYLFTSLLVYLLTYLSTPSRI